MVHWVCLLGPALDQLTAADASVLLYTALRAAVRTLVPPTCVASGATQLPEGATSGSAGLVQARSTS